MRSRAVLLVALAALSSSCKGRDKAAADTLPGASLAAFDPLGPPSQATLRTTDGSIALHNLDGKIEFFESSLVKYPADPAPDIRLVSLLSTRYQFLGRVGDLERAGVLGEEAVRKAPGVATSYVARASARSGLHLFPAALADLAEAEARGAKPATIVGPRAAVLEAQGDLDGALALRHAAREADPDLANLTLEASLLGQMGKTEQASELFHEAMSHYRSVEPLPVAWSFFLQAVFWEGVGNRSRARAFYAAALERVPGYAHAASHLATLSPAEDGIKLLTPIVTATDDPEYVGVLADILRTAHRSAEADPLFARAGARYDELVQRHPEAYAEHAATFLLDEGRDLDRALVLAQKNLELRKTAKAYELALTIALAAGKRTEACVLGTEVLKLRYASGMLKSIAADACSHPEPVKP